MKTCCFSWPPIFQDSEAAELPPGYSTRWTAIAITRLVNFQPRSWVSTVREISVVCIGIFVWNSSLRTLINVHGRRPRMAKAVFERFDEAGEQDMRNFFETLSEKDQRRYQHHLRSASLGQGFGCAVGWYREGQANVGCFVRTSN
jgi:hypothetical protein